LTQQPMSNVAWLFHETTLLYIASSIAMQCL
jgi:hypothetical protein